MGILSSLTSIENDVVVLGKGDDERHQVAAGKVVLADGEESRSFLGVVVSEEALEVFETGCKAW
jgi:hypothetical protein